MAHNSPQCWNPDDKGAHEETPDRQTAPLEIGARTATAPPPSCTVSVGMSALSLCELLQELLAGVDVELGVNRPDMAAYGVLGNDEVLGDPVG